MEMQILLKSVTTSILQRYGKCIAHGGHFENYNCRVDFSKYINIVKYY